jgi:hypothetical protein
MHTDSPIEQPTHSLVDWLKTAVIGQLFEEKVDCLTIKLLFGYYLITVKVTLSYQLAVQFTNSCLAACGTTRGLRRAAEGGRGG